MILIDAGPLLALNDPRDGAHQQCRAALANFAPDTFLTTWPCVAEAAYFLGLSGGFAKQKGLWDAWQQRMIVFSDLTEEEIQHSLLLMERYQDLPMDLADATLVAIADYRQCRRIFTLDSHFFAYRLRDGSSLDILIPTKS
jgi:predicted nucleic acid-binding protein